MKITSVKNPVMASWLVGEGARLDAPPFLSDALEARYLLKHLPVRKQNLNSLTCGHDGGIFNGPMFARSYVDDPEHGVPFLGSSEMLWADLSHLPLLSKKSALSPRLSFLRLEEGMTLISCSGTIGKTVYVRPDMVGLWSSQHIMKVVPNSNLVKPGYLYAFLSSKYGKAQVTAGTYGAIIQHIEPRHIATVSVPRLELVEEEVHHLVVRGAAKRNQASIFRGEALAQILAALTWSPSTERSIHTVASSADAVRRMDAFPHSLPISRAKQFLTSRPPSVRLGSKAQKIFEPNRGPRMKVEDITFGVPFLSSTEVFKVDPVGDYLISRRTPHFSDLLVSDKDILLPRSGQVGGIIGRAVLPLPTYYGDAATEHLVRVRCRSQADAFYLWAVLASDPGYLAAVGTAYGSSIPSLDCELLSELEVPWFNEKSRGRIVEPVSKMIALQASAIQDERKAVSLVESAIQELT
jgi:type I restriction enzyme, S subunit